MHRTSPTCPRRLPVLPERRAAARPGVTAFVGPTGRARPTSSRRSATWPRSARTGSPPTPRWSGSAPSARWSAARSCTASVDCWSSWRSPRARPTGPGSTGRRCRAREVLGALRIVLFAPEDLALVKGDPSERRRFLDELLVARGPAVRRGARRLRPGAQAAQRPAQVGWGRGDRGRASRPVAPSTCGTPISPRTVPSCWPPGSSWSRRSPAARGQGLRGGRATASARGCAARLPVVAGLRPTRGGPDRAARGRGAAGRRSPASGAPSSSAGVAGRAAPRRPGADGWARCRPRVTPATASRGRSRWRCGWRRTTCCAPRAAASRCWSSTTSSPSSTPTGATGWPRWSARPSRCWSRPPWPRCAGAALSGPGSTCWRRVPADAMSESWSRAPRANPADPHPAVPEEGRAGAEPRPGARGRRRRPSRRPRRRGRRAAASRRGSRSARWPRKRAPGAGWSGALGR